MTAAAQTPLPEKGVSCVLARERAKFISGVSYHLSFKLTPQAERIKGNEEISFILKSVPPELVFDFRDLDAEGRTANGKIGNLIINGKPAENYRQINGHTVVAGKLLKTGENRITLDFESGVAASNRPFVRYSDSADNSEYIYSLLAPSDASLAFPCFDQPDLKARFTLETIAPENWTVVSNARLADSKSVFAEAGYRRLVFQETLPISTYLFAFAAGAFREIKNDDAPVPSSLFVRRSQFEKAQNESGELFRVTNAGMRKMIEYFDCEFPFPKYDFVMLPGFAFRGMEHAGATFFREDALLFRQQPTEIDRLNRSILILHELSHQWFGDLVTMRWFDDLWLKEGFANFIAFTSLAADASYQPEFVWKRFYQNFKPDAYEADITSGTTPLRQTIKNLKDAKTAYGAVVYTKAPAVLKNLEFVLGPTHFRQGVRLFLRQHKFSSADWRAFIKAFETASGKFLQRWANDYIVRRGVSLVETKWSCNTENRIENFELHQRDSLGRNEPRLIESQILLFYDDGEPPKMIRYRLDTTKKNIREAIGQRCPNFVFANDYDFGYGYFLLDAKSRLMLETRIDKIKNSFSRSMLWGALWETVRTVKFPPIKFINAALRALPDEEDEDLARNQLERIVRAYRRYLTARQQKGVIGEIEDLCRRQVSNETIETGIRINYLRTLFLIAETGAASDFLKSLLSGEIKIPGIKLRAADRWQIVAKLSASDDKQAEQLFATEKAQDTDFNAQKQAYVAAAARADAQTKRFYFNEYIRDAQVPEDWIEGSLWNFNSPNHSQITLSYLKPALAELPKIQRTRKIFFTVSWLKAFIGGQQSEKALKVVQQFLATSRLQKNLRLKVLEITDDLERAVQIRRKFEGKNAKF